MQATNQPERTSPQRKRFVGGSSVFLGGGGRGGEGGSEEGLGEVVVVCGCL